MGGAVFLPCLLFGLRHPSTGALGWGQVKMVPSRRAHTIEYTPIPLPPVFLSPQWPQLPPAFPGDSTKPANTSGSGSYEVTAFSLGPSAHKTLCAPSNSTELNFWFPQFCGVFVIKPYWPSKPNALKSPLTQCQTPRLGSLMWGSEFSLLWEKLCDIIIYQLVGCPLGGYRIWLGILWMCPSYHLTVASSLSLDVEYLFWWVPVFFVSHCFSS